MKNCKPDLCLLADQKRIFNLNKPSTHSFVNGLKGTKKIRQNCSFFVSFIFLNEITVIKNNNFHRKIAFLNYIIIMSLHYVAMLDFVSKLYSIWLPFIMSRVSILEAYKIKRDCCY